MTTATATAPRKRRRKTAEQRHAEQAEALERTEGFSQNDARVMEAFAEQGLSVTPRLDVLTFKAWLALGRSVRKGEKATTVPIWLPVRDRSGDVKTDSDGRPEMRMAYAKLFHFHQTRETPREYRERDGWRADARVTAHRQALGLSAEPSE